MTSLGVQNGTLRMEEMHLFVACFEGQEEKMRPEGLSCFGVENGTLRVGILSARKAPNQIVYGRRKAPSYAFRRSAKAVNNMVGF